MATLARGGRGGNHVAAAQSSSCSNSIAGTGSNAQDDDPRDQRQQLLLPCFRAIVRPDGSVELLESIEVAEERQALVTILENEDDSIVTMLLSESALGNDWARQEEDEAWSHLQHSDAPRVFARLASSSDITIGIGSFVGQGVTNGKGVGVSPRRGSLRDVGWAGDVV